MVTPVAPTKRYTIDDLDQFPDDGKHRELVDGQIVEWDMPNLFHGFLMALICREVERYVRERRLGIVVFGDVMVRILEIVYDARGADVAFYGRDRIPKDKDAAATVVPSDFVVEILSPSDKAGMVRHKVRDWRRSGVRLLWYVNPEGGFTTVCHDGRITIVDANDMLDGADVLPGLQIRLQDLFNELEMGVEQER